MVVCLLVAFEYKSNARFAWKNELHYMNRWNKCNSCTKSITICNVGKRRVAPNAKKNKNPEVVVIISCWCFLSPGIHLEFRSHGRMDPSDSVVFPFHEHVIERIKHTKGEKMKWKIIIKSAQMKRSEGGQLMFVCACICVQTNGYLNCRIEHSSAQTK